MPEVKDVKELKELVLGVEKLILLCLGAFKDGIQVEDLTAILVKLATDKAFRDAVEGLRSVGAEAQDISVQEGVELGMVVLQMVPKIIEASKK